jgi:hypothetical protein
MVRRAFSSCAPNSIQYMCFVGEAMDLHVVIQSQQVLSTF